MHPQLRTDNFLIPGLLVACWVVLAVSDGVSRGTFVFAGTLGVLASMVVSLAALASIASRKLAFTTFHWLFAAYLAVYLVFALARNWTFLWVGVAMGAAAGTVIFLTLALSRWLGWLR